MTINRLYKAFPNGWFMALFYPHDWTWQFRLCNRLIFRHSLWNSSKLAQTGRPSPVAHDGTLSRPYLQPVPTISWNHNGTPWWVAHGSTGLNDRCVYLISLGWTKWWNTCFLHSPLLHILARAAGHTVKANFADSAVRCLKELLPWDSLRLIGTPYFFELRVGQVGVPNSVQEVGWLQVFETRSSNLWSREPTWRSS